MGKITAFIAMCIRKWNPFYNMYDDEVGQGAERSGTIIKAVPATEVLYNPTNDYFLLRTFSVFNNGTGAARIITLEDGPGGAVRLYVTVANNAVATWTQLEGIRFETSVNIVADAMAAGDIRATAGGFDRNF